MPALAAVRATRADRVLALLAMVATALLLAGCGDSRGGLSGVTACSTVAVLDDVAELTRFRNEDTSSLANVEFRVDLEDFRGICDFDNRIIELSLDVFFEVRRGPANAEGEASFAYFVAVLDSQEKVLLRQRFPVIAKFETAATRIDFTDEFGLQIPRNESDAVKDYTVYLGLEMTPGEIAFNRQRRTR